MYEYCIQKMRMDIETELKTGEIERCFYLSAEQTNKAKTCPNTTI